MAKGVDVSLLLIGEKGLQRKLDRLAPALQRRIVRKAAREAGRPILATAKTLCPVGLGAPGRKHLRDTLKMRAVKSRSSIGVKVQTGTREELGIDPGDPYFWPAALEFGHDNVPAHSYLRAAMDQNRATSLGIMSREIGAGITREAKR